MGAFLDKPKTEKYNEGQEGGGLRYGLSTMQGWRIEMEDSHSAVIGLPDVSDKVSWFAVFDGHAGSRVSAHCSGHLLECVLSSDSFKSAIQNEKTLSKDEMFEKVKSAVLKGFLELDEKLRKLPEVINGDDKSGTTAVCVLITEKYVMFINCGDSRGVLSRDSKPAMVTIDHKPCNPLEKERILNAGGSVMIQRVNGSLAVSRALGDFEYKSVEGKGPMEQLVSPEPDFYIIDRDSTKDDLLVLACDGVWDVMSNEEICEYVTSRLKVSQDLEAAANDVIDTCLHKGSRDNMSIIIIAFPGAPKVSNENIKRENKLNELLKQRVIDILSEDSDIDFSSVFHKLTEENIADLPPGGGIYAKKSYVQEVFEILCPDKEDASVSCGDNNNA